MPINYHSARKLLETTFAEAEAALLQGSTPKVSDQIRAACEVLFRSRTQAYREVFLGCVIARIQDKRINIRQPYVGKGTNAFSGRALDERVINAFLTKIAPAGIEDYLFFVKLSGVNHEAKRQARQYFAQGHEVNFLEIKDWIIMSLATMGKKGRATFNRELLNLLEAPDVHRALKVAWNEQIQRVIGE